MMGHCQLFDMSEKIVLDLYQTNSSVRERFPILRSKAYFNSGSYGALSVDVRDAYDQYLAEREHYGAFWDQWMAGYERLRVAIAALLCVDAAEISVGSSLSQCLNSLASSLRFDGQRNRVVITDFDFPTTAQIWHAQQQRGAEVVCVAANDTGDEIPLERFEQAIDEHTLIVSIPHVCYRNGAMLDIGAISKIARRHGAMVYVDAYQSLGTRMVNARQLDIDFLSGGCTKYLLGSSGTAFLYVRHELLEQLAPTQTGWFAQADIGAMDTSGNTPAPDARRFESGTPCVPSTYAAHAGLGIISEIGLECIERQIRGLTTAIMDRAKAARYVVSTPQDPAAYGPMIAIRSTDMHRLVGLLREEHVVTSCRDGNIRIATHFYNSADDIDRLFESLARHSDLLERT